MSETDKTGKFGFVGLGAMGEPMARNLISAGHKLVVYDINPAKCAILAGLGAEVGEGPADVARRTSLMFSMVDTTAQAQEVISGPNGFIAGGAPGDLVVSMSTIDPVALEKMQPALRERGMDIIDCPVAGMIEGARDASIKGFAGGDAAALARARPALAAMTSEVSHVGPRVGQGIIVKLVNNMLVQAGRVLVVEAMVLGTKAGIDPERLIEMIGKTSGNSFVFQRSAPRMVSRDFTGVRLDIALKDMELEAQLARSLNVPAFMLNTAYQVNMMGKAAGLGSEDPAAIVKVYEQLTGITVGKKNAG